MNAVTHNRQERLTLFHFLQRQARRTVQLIIRILDSSCAFLTSSIDIWRNITEYLRQRYDATTVNDECRIRMELEVSKFVPLHVRENLIVTVTNTELYLALRQGALNKSPG